MLLNLSTLRFWQPPLLLIGKLSISASDVGFTQVEQAIRLALD